MASGRLEAVTSALSLLEVLVIPYRKGQLAIAEHYEALLNRSRGLRLCELDLPVLLALEAMRNDRNPEARGALRAALLRGNRLRASLVGHEGQVTTVALLPGIPVTGGIIGAELWEVKRTSAEGVLAPPGPLAVTTT